MSGREADEAGALFPRFEIAHAFCTLFAQIRPDIREACLASFKIVKKLRGGPAYEAGSDIFSHGGLPFFLRVFARCTHHDGAGARARGSGCGEIGRTDAGTQARMVYNK